MEAHYRDPIFLHKRFLDLFFCLLIFHPFRSITAQTGAFLIAFSLAQRRQSNQSLHDCSFIMR
ncbi:hypothetical protein DM684_21750 [Salmonella bongori]|nr:hypothetical protein [Salmonella bongori]ECI3520612.1 hypothetical protein [Salmonella bongori]